MPLSLKLCGQQAVDDSAYFVSEGHVGFERGGITEPKEFREDELRLHLKRGASRMPKELAPFASGKPAMPSAMFEGIDTAQARSCAISPNLSSRGNEAVVL